MNEEHIDVVLTPEILQYVDTKPESSVLVAPEEIFSPLLKIRNKDLLEMIETDAAEVPVRDKTGSIVGKGNKMPSPVNGVIRLRVGILTVSE